MQVVGISAFAEYVKSVIGSNDIMSDIVLEGEIGSFTRHRASGHCYFTLKDDKSTLHAVMFSGDANRLSFVPQEGMLVHVRGGASLYSKDCSFKFYATLMLPAGKGTIQDAFERMRERLQKQGLFDDDHKMPLPSHPTRIGVVTSKDGAAIHDIMSVARRRAYTDVTFILCDIPVQGVKAAPAAQKAIKMLDDAGCCDVIILTRGGGSAEDLSAFNAEELAHAVYSATTPIVSAIGHESDLVITDYVADLRAATPTAAAEIVLADKQPLLHRLSVCKTALTPTRLRSVLVTKRQLVSGMRCELKDGVGDKLAYSRDRYEGAHSRLLPYNPQNLLKKGYAIVKSGGSVVAQAPSVGDMLDVETNTANLHCRVEGVHLKPDKRSINT